MMTIGGSLFIRNAIQYDYCVEESILSLVPLCDEIVVLDCKSTDGTTQKLAALARKYPKIRLHKNITWECAADYNRLRILANLAISYLKTDWHFMIQADEVLHEESVPILKSIAQKHRNESATFLVRRPHIFGNMDHYIRHDIPSTRKPASDYVFRFGRIHHKSVGDAESLKSERTNINYKDYINLFHYGYVRKNSVNLTKAIDMQSWFNGVNSAPDERLLNMQRTDGIFRPEGFFKWEELKRLEIEHPLVARKWVDERRSEHPFGPPESP